MRLTKLRFAPSGVVTAASSAVAVGAVLSFALLVGIGGSAPASSVATSSGAGDATVKGQTYQRPPSPGAAQPNTFSIAGDVSGLQPTVTVPLTLTLRNPNAFAIRVTAVTTTVGAPSAQCPAASISVSSFDGTAGVVVQARATASTALQVTMSPEAPDACSGGTFPIQYGGTAVRA